MFPPELWHLYHEGPRLQNENKLKPNSVSLQSECPDSGCLKMFLFWGLVWHLARISGIMTIQSCRKRQVERDLWRSSCSPVLEVQWASWSKRVTCSSLRLSFERLQVLHYENRAKYLMSYTDFFKMKYICFWFFLRLSPADFQSWIFTFHDWSAGALSPSSLVIVITCYRHCSSATHRGVLCSVEAQLYMTNWWHFTHGLQWQSLRCPLLLLVQPLLSNSSLWLPGR